MENKEKESGETSSWAWLPLMLVFMTVFAIVIDRLEVKKAEREIAQVRTELEGCLVLKLRISTNSVWVGDREIGPAEWRKMYRNAATEMLLLLVEESQDTKERLSLYRNLAGILGSTNMPPITPETVVAYSALHDCRQLRH